MNISSNFISGVLIAVVAGILLALIFNFWEKIKSWLKRFFNALRAPEDGSAIPNTSFRFVVKSTETFWHLGNRGNEPSMQVILRCSVTNITNGYAKIVECVVKAKNVEHVLPSLINNGKASLDCTFLPRSTSRLDLHFWITPPACKIGETFKTDIIFIDQFGNEHKLKRVEFKYM